MGSLTARVGAACLLACRCSYRSLGAMAAMPPAFDRRLPHRSDSGRQPTAAADSSSSHHGPPWATCRRRSRRSRWSAGSSSPALRRRPAGQIADVAVYKGYAYLNSWDDPDCARGGTYVVDIRNPAAPKEVGFIPAQPATTTARARTWCRINTPAFQGDMLAVNDETYGSNVGLTTTAACPRPRYGARRLRPLRRDRPREPDAARAGRGRPDRDDDGTRDAGARPVANSYHSVFVWQDGPRAFLVACDNIELTDVDIFDITDPASPECRSATSTWSSGSRRSSTARTRRGGDVFHHDMVVKQIGGRPVMLSTTGTPATCSSTSPTRPTRR